MDTLIKWQDRDGVYQLFDNTGIDHLPRDHVISLFSGRIPVIASEGGAYITNNEALAGMYRAKGKRVALFRDLPPSERKFASVGFVGG